MIYTQWETIDNKPEIVNTIDNTRLQLEIADGDDGGSYLWATLYDLRGSRSALDPLHEFQIGTLDLHTLEAFKDNQFVTIFMAAVCDQITTRAASGLVEWNQVFNKAYQQAASMFTDSIN